MPEIDIDTRKKRLDEAADRARRDRVAWHGEMGETCPRCRVQVPARYQLTLPDTDVTGCLRCLEMQAHLIYRSLDDVPADLAGTGGQQDALRLVAHEFRQHIKAAERGREPSTRRKSASRWAAHSGWEASDAWEPSSSEEDGAAEYSSDYTTDRWPKKPMRTASQPKPRVAKVRPTIRRATTEAATRRPADILPADVLGLTGTPSRADIMAAFRRAALVCHPDYGGSAEAFRELVAARDALLAKC